ncbi:MAG: DUF1566 domain-containing protein, partial [Polyangiaceae bacterium]
MQSIAAMLARGCRAGCAVALLAAGCGSGAARGAPDRDGGDASGRPVDASIPEGAPSDATQGDGPPEADGPVDEGDAGTPSCSSPVEAGDGATAADPDDWAQWPVPNSPVDVAAGAPNAASYGDNGDGTVSDRVTGLMWQQTAEPSPTDFPTALSTCASLALGGHTDWRLPRYIELASLVDYSSSVPAIDTTAFPGAVPTDFWASTIVAGSTCNAWEIYFTAGDAGFDPIAGIDNAVRCVRTEIPPASALGPPARYT